MPELKVKKAIKLPQDVADDYAIGSESLWFLDEENGYRLINIPFFIENLSMEDVVALRELDDGLYEIKDIVSKSPNSTIWINVRGDDNAKSLTKDIHQLGCGVEGGIFQGFYAINIPASVDIDKIFELLESKQYGEVGIYYASERHLG